ncbi:hypothetical protein FRB99_001460 [Tulasnella sp. 403]|nr:hypothetical protein FRB99_001460 [Tulasnella sp. 403]
MQTSRSPSSGGSSMMKFNSKSPTFRIGEPVFRGGSGTDCEDFVRDVRKRALSKGKHFDDEWIAYYAASCMTGAALRWFEQLEERTQKDWKLLRRALLDNYPSDQPNPNAIIPGRTS